MVVVEGEVEEEEEVEKLKMIRRKPHRCLGTELSADEEGATVECNHVSVIVSSLVLVTQRMQASL